MEYKKQTKTEKDRKNVKATEDGMKKMYNNFKQRLGECKESLKSLYLKRQWVKNAQMVRAMEK